MRVLAVLFLVAALAGCGEALSPKVELTIIEYDTESFVKVSLKNVGTETVSVYQSNFRLVDAKGIVANREFVASSYAFPITAEVGAGESVVGLLSFSFADAPSEPVTLIYEHGSTKVQATPAAS